MDILERAIITGDLFAVCYLFEHEGYDVSGLGEIEVSGKNIGRLYFSRLGDVEEEIVRYLHSKFYQAGFKRGQMIYTEKRREEEAKKTNIL